MKTNRLFIPRIISFIIDLSIVFSLSLIFNFLVPLNQHIGLLHVFSLVYIIFNLTCLIFFSYTPGKYLFKLTITSISNEKPKVVKLLMREIIFKYLIIYLFILIITYFIGKTKSIGLFIDDNLVLIFILIWIFTKKAWWDSLSGIIIKKVEISKKQLLNFNRNVFLFFGISFLLIFVLNNLGQNHNYSFFGFKYPINFKKHITNSQVNERVDFLKSQHLSSKDYIFELFKKNDIVVLCEFHHREITTWDFISELVHDERFINQVGNVFTEYGSASKQTQVDSFLSTQFPSDTLLLKETAKLLLFKNSGFYYFMKNLNILNSKLPDSLKIHEYFTDCDTNNEYIHTTKDSFERNRDSLMASIITNKYRHFQESERRKKCLVITNTRHAYGLVDKNSKEIRGYKNNETRYVFKEFPNMTANVLLNCMTMNTLQIPYPIRYGLWDKAFEEVNNKQIGFNFKNSPFGEDKFDLFPWIKTNIQYQDVFTGFIFIRPANEWKYNSYYPYREYAANYEYNEKMRNGIINSGYPIINYKFKKFQDETIWNILQGLNNFIPYLLYLLLILPVLIILIWNRLKSYMEK